MPQPPSHHEMIVSGPKAYTLKDGRVQRVCVGSEASPHSPFLLSDMNKPPSS